MDYYLEKREAYFTNARHDLISLLPKKEGLTILEIGAGGGDTLAELKKSGIAKEVTGVELFDLAGTRQNDPLIDNFIIANIENDELNLPLNHFDAVLCGDVLEHLLDPWKVVEKLTVHLKPGGVIIASMPNIRSTSAFKKIFLRGDFGYTKEGLFDKTHFRFFCKRNMIDLLTSQSLKLVSVTSNLEFKKNSRTRIFNRVTLRLFEEFLTVQFLIVVRKIN